MVWPSIAGGLIAVVLLLAWRWMAAEKKAAAAIAVAKQEIAENEARKIQADISKLAAVGEARDKAIADTRAGTLSDKLQKHYID
jgi:hypothetical protein